ncbi:MAG: hypothetical protein ACXVR1_03350 [Solirubrobacteraceae bacterium]
MSLLAITVLGFTFSGTHALTVLVVVAVFIGMFSLGFLRARRR